MFFGNRLHSGPLRIVIHDSNPLDGGKVYHTHFVVRRNQRSGGHVILDVLRQASEDELIRRRTAIVWRCLHGDGLPHACALIVGEYLRALRPHAGDARRDELIAVAPYRNVTRRYGYSVERGHILLRPRPKQRSAVADISWSSRDHPYQHAKTRKARATQSKEA